MVGVGDDIEQRLAATTEALREHELLTRRHADLRHRMDETVQHLGMLRAGHAQEQRDVDRLEGLSLTRVLASLRGNRDDALGRERAEADAARYRVAEAEARLAALDRERAAALAGLNRCASAPADFAALLEEKERYLRASADPRRARLLELADERGRLTAEAHEIGEALRAADEATHALALVRNKLGSAADWSTYDTFLGGGVIGSAVKHNRLDEAARAAARADQCLAVLRTELADVPGLQRSAPQLAIGELTRFVDIWFDNIFTDLSVRDRIKQAVRNVEEATRVLGEVRERLRQRLTGSRTRLTAIGRSGRASSSSADGRS